MDKNLYKHSHFKPDDFGNGGDKRTAQINEILAEAGINFKEADFEFYAPKSKDTKYYLKGLIYNKNLRFNLKKDYAIGRYLSQFEKFTEQKKPSAFIWESVIEYNLLLANILHLKNIPFIAVPHNIESLISNSKSFSTGVKSPYWLNEELGYLNYSKKVFTISREEQWLLALHGINADYLPYYPTNKTAEFLLNIRKKKENAQKTHRIKKVLLLGTFYNPPTRQGYINLLEKISTYTDIMINVAGFGSEMIQDKFNSPRIKFWGSVNKETLEEIIIDNDIAIIHQEPSTGALTRIPELLIAGIPIIANEVASRSNYNLNGLTTYSNYEELLDLIHTSQVVPDMPKKNSLAEKRFINTIKKYL